MTAKSLSGTPPQRRLCSGAFQKYKDRHLTRNAVITWDQRAKRFIKTKQWGEAIKVYDLALEQFPNHTTLRNNLKYCL